MLGAKAMFGGFQEERTDAEAAGWGDYVDGDDVASSAGGALSDDEAGDVDVTCCEGFRLPVSGFPSLRAGLHRDQGKGCGTAHVEAQFGAGVGNSGGKAGLVDAPEGVEILVLKVANGIGHGPL